MDREPAEFGVLVGSHRCLFREGLIGLVRGAWPHCQFDPQDSFEALKAALATGSPRLVLVDLNLPGMAGVTGMRTLRALAPEVGIVVLAEEVCRETILSCLDAGAQGYVSMAATPQQLHSAIQTVLAGGVFAPATLASRSVSAPMPTASRLPSVPNELDTECLAPFSGRKRDVLELLMEGCSTKTIARRLDLSVGTVKVHLAAVYRALGARSRLEAVTNARRRQPFGLERLVDPDETIVQRAALHGVAA